jgi:hypothetical protein
MSETRKPPPIPEDIKAFNKALIADFARQPGAG